MHAASEAIACRRAAAPISVSISACRWAAAGGGSSNAATVLVALNHLWGCGLSEDELATLGLQLGPMCRFSYAAMPPSPRVGEILTPVEPEEKWYWPRGQYSDADHFRDPELPRNTPRRSINTLLNCEFSNDCELIARKRFREVDAALSAVRICAVTPDRHRGLCVC